MKYKAVTEFGTKFSGIIRINESGNILLCNKSGIGVSYPRLDVKGYGTARNVRKGTVRDLAISSVAKIEIMYNIPETPVKPKPKPLPEVKPKPTKVFIPITSLKGVKSGTEFTANIDGTEVTGKIQVENGKYYLCQNKNNGCSCGNKLGYKYSWAVGPGTASELKSQDVSNIKIEYIPTGIPTLTPEFKGLQVDFCENYVVINGVKITDEQLQGIAIAQGVFEVTN
jgi:hypothetical protein